MGLFDKLFGGSKRPEPAADAVQTPSTASTNESAAGTPTGAPPPRRERSKPGPLATSSNGDVSDEPEALPRAPVAIAEITDDTENAPLLRAISAIVQNDNPANRRELYKAILDAQLYLVSMGNTDELGEKGEIILQEGQQLSLATIRDPKGQSYLPAFTDVDRMALTLPDDARYLRISAMAACRMFLQGTGEGIVINPGQPPSGVITRGEASILAAGSVPEVDETGGLKGTSEQHMRIAIGKLPVTPPETFLNAIREAAEAQPTVLEVHLFLAGIEDQPPRQMIGVLIDESTPPEAMHPAFEAIGKAAFAARATETDAFDMMPLNSDMIEAIRPLEGVVYSRVQQV